MMLIVGFEIMKTIEEFADKLVIVPDEFALNDRTIRMLKKGVRFFFITE